MFKHVIGLCYCGTVLTNKFAAALANQFLPLGYHLHNSNRTVKIIHAIMAVGGATVRAYNADDECTISDSCIQAKMIYRAFLVQKKPF